MSYNQAVAFIGFMVGRLGGGYHPDNSLSEYVMLNSDEPSFTDAEIKRLQPLHDQACDILGEDIYTIGLEMTDLCCRHLI
jgi:hypothetical protein